MAHKASIPPPDKMMMTGNLPENWDFFCESYKHYEVAIGINTKPDNIRVATLITVMGRECHEILRNLEIPEGEKTVDNICAKIKNYFQPSINVTYERYRFGTAIQDSSETIDMFLNRLRKLSLTCKYESLRDEMIRDRLVIGVADPKIRARLLREPDLTLPRALDICRTAEITTEQLKTFDSPEEVLHELRSRPSRPRCKYCGDNHKPRECPAFGTNCSNCGKKNHFAKVCRSKKSESPQKPGHGKSRAKLHEIHREDDGSSDESIYSLTSGRRSQYFTRLKFAESDCDISLRVQLDPGATVNILTKEDYAKISTSPLVPTATRITLFNGTQMKPPLGQTVAKCSANGITKRVKFQVVEDGQNSLLSGRACEAFQLIQFAEESLVNAIKFPSPHSETKGSTAEEILSEYSDVFKGLGKLPGTYHIDIDSSVKPVQNARRRVPVPVKERLKAKIDELEEMGVLAKVSQPTPWISSMVVVSKPDKLRLCLDPIPLNKAIKRNHYPIPTIDDISPQLAQAKVFSVVDAKDGFLQVVLDDESSYLTTFWTPFGRYRWCRMPFGISSAPEEFQRRLDQCLEGLENVAVIADDIVIFGTGVTDEEASKSHDVAFAALLNRCRERCLKLNKKKLKYKLTSVSYMGHILSSQGLSPDPLKVKAIQDMPAPTDVAGVQRLIGMVTYMAKFMPQLSTICEPLRRLTDKDVEFDWMQQHDEAFEKLKSLLSSAPILKFYDVNKDVTIECDSSDVGLGAVLMQDGHPVAYASRALTPTERNYAQIEKECLSIVFATERFDQYILGKTQVLIQNDHKPLMTIFKKPILTSPKRLQRMRLRLQKYSLVVEYKPGPKMHISDTLSRAHLPNIDGPTESEPFMIFKMNDERAFQEELASLDMEKDLHVTDQRLDAIRLESNRDVQMITLTNCISKGWPNDKNDVPLTVREFWPYRDELSTQNGLVFRGTRIVIPTTLRSQLIQRAHASHMGIQYTSNTAREVMYWPSMTADLTEAVKRCHVCQETQDAQTKEPLMTYPVPQYPWQVVAADCFEIKGRNYVVVVDVYSDFIEVADLGDMTTNTLIVKLKQIFATHGVPAIFISDNGPNLASTEFVKFSRDWDFEHVKSSPHHHQSNGRAEAAVKTMKKLMSRALAEGGDPWKALLEFRNTLTPGMNSSPTQRLMSRRTRSLLPCKPELYKPEVQKLVQENVVQRRKRAKMYYDRSAKSLPELLIGQPIRAKVHPQQQHSNWVPGVVRSQIAPRSYMVEVNGRLYRRNRIHIRDSHAEGTNRVSPLPQQPPNSDINAETPEIDPLPSVASDQSEVQAPVVTKSGRVPRIPAKFQDYELAD